MNGVPGRNRLTWVAVGTSILLASLPVRDYLISTGRFTTQTNHFWIVRGMITIGMLFLWWPALRWAGRPRQARPEARTSAPTNPPDLLMQLLEYPPWEWESTTPEKMSTGALFGRPIQTLEQAAYAFELLRKSKDQLELLIVGGPHGSSVWIQHFLLLSLRSTGGKKFTVYYDRVRLSPNGLGIILHSPEFGAFQIYPVEDGKSMIVSPIEQSSTERTLRSQA